MDDLGKKITFKIEFDRILELLTDQIYQSPLALLRENTQNAYDAILMRKAQLDNFEPGISILVDNHTIEVSDNGIGMTEKELEHNFWHAGKSGKNTEAARLAGVVGTFGIGALSNFGVANELTVESESFSVGKRTISKARRDQLSVEDPGISITQINPTGAPGTVVRASLDPSVDLSVQQAEEYLRDFVEFLDIPVYLNGKCISGTQHRDLLPSDRSAWLEERLEVSIAEILTGNMEVMGMASGELRVVVSDVRIDESPRRAGCMVLLQDRHAIRTLRSGFGLATVGVPSQYNWGGVVDLPILTPTAGREALDDLSNQILQTIISAIDRLVSSAAADHEESYSNEHFLQWIASTAQFDRCGVLEVNVRPYAEPQTLSSIVQNRSVRYYSGRDSSIVQTYASEEQPLILLSRRNPRRQCEHGYLSANGIEEVDTTPVVLAQIPLAEQSFAQTALAARIARVLEEDYFIAADIQFGRISGGLPLLVTDTGPPVNVVCDPDATSVAPILALFDEDYGAFDPFVKDFVRSAVFPRVSDLVPSSTRAGAEAFLRHLRTNRELFEYEFDDKADLEEILEELRSGRVTLAEATKQIVDTSRSIIEVSQAGAVPVSSVVGSMDEQDEEDILPDPLAPRPSIDRRNEVTEALILTSDEPVLNGYSCFLALSDRVQRERGDFFLHPHKSEVVWGGRKVLFIFQHHSGDFGLYYDILCPGLVGEIAGGCPFVTSTILTQNRTFIPIPSPIADSFVPVVGERKRLEVRADLLYLREGRSRDNG